jgi:hypothetical protein
MFGAELAGGGDLLGHGLSVDILVVVGISLPGL